MALVSLIPHSIRPNSGAKLIGVGNGSGTSLAGLFKLGGASAQVVDIRARHDGATGTDARVIYARLHQYGTGGGEAVRAYAFANNAAAATTGTLNGMHASLSVATSSAISGAGHAARFTLEAASASRTLSGTVSAINLDSNIGASNTVPANSWSFMSISKSGAVDMPLFLNILDDQVESTAASGSALKSLKVKLTDGSYGYINILAAS
jgi:hypothetical protein